jgi:FixJ family two-component response regulator
MQKFSAFVIESDRAVRESIGWLLDAWGVEAITFATPLGFLRNFSPAPSQRGCVIADARLPLIGGVELQRILRTMGCDWPVIITTGAGEVAEAVHALKAGALDYLEKPMCADRLVYYVRRSMHGEAAEPQATGPPRTLLDNQRRHQTLRFDRKGRAIEPPQLPAPHDVTGDAATGALAS